MPEPTPDPDTPSHVGAYRILDKLGEGGMGTVYLAEQREPVRRRVALKLIKLGMDSQAVVRRFEQERQALALMDHEGIAKVYDVGTSERGQPYFVMELVKGVPLDAFCEQQRLSLEARLQLMQQVCSAVQHAHQKGVIHRDLKPGNVLVSDLDGRLQIKIIDFGLAKAVGQKLIQESLFTDLGVVMGTPEYMAPEQADPDNLDVDTRADVYSLGVMLYQLLVGQLPFGGAALRDAGLLEMQRVLREQEPPKPSALLMAAAPRSKLVARQLRVSVRLLLEALRRDLDWVLLKTLEKDRGRRYPSANALAEDLQRFLDGEPLEAGPPSAGYRLQKLWRRNRATFSVAAAVLLTSLSLGSIAWVKYRDASRLADETGALVAQAVADKEAAATLAQKNAALAASEREAKEAAEAALVARDDALARARERSRELEQATEFQRDQFAEVDPDQMGARLRADLRELVAARCDARALGAAEKQAALAAHDERMRSVDFTGLALRALDENFFAPGLKVLEVEFTQQPLLQASLRQSLAEILRQLGRLELAFEPQVQAAKARERLLGADDPATLASASSLGTMLQVRGELEAAESKCREVLEVSRRSLGADHLVTVQAAVRLASVLRSRGELDGAEPLLRDALERRRRLSGPEDFDTLNTMVALGSVLRDKGDLDASEALCREALAGFRRVLDADDPATLIALSNLASLLAVRNKTEEAEELFREALAGMRRALGDDHPDTVLLLYNLGLALYEQGELDEAGPLLLEALATRRRLYGSDHIDTLYSIGAVASLQRARGEWQSAEDLLRESLAGRRRLLGATHPSTLVAANNLAGFLVKRGRAEEALPLLRASAENMRRLRGGDHPNTLAFSANLGAVLRDLKRYSEAEPVLREVLLVARRVLGDASPDTRRVLLQLHDCLQQLDRSEDARALLDDFLRTAELGADDPFAAELQAARDRAGK